MLVSLLETILVTYLMDKDSTVPQKTETDTEDNKKEDKTKGFCAAVCPAPGLGCTCACAVTPVRRQGETCQHRDKCNQEGATLGKCKCGESPDVT